jgi:hypothetical protein
MPYSVTKTNGTAITVEDGSTNTSSTSLTLIGKNYPGYGVFLNQNFVRLLENFSNSASPDTVTGSPAVQGQLWWDSNNKLLKVYEGTAWKVISSSMSSEFEPDGAVVGDLWWDTRNSQLKVYPGGPTGTPWVTIGPAFTTATGQTGALADIIADNSQSQTVHSVIKFYVDNDLVSILSQDPEFTPATTDLPGFPAIKPGFNLATNIANLKYNGTATSADTLAGGSIQAGDLARLSVTNTFTRQQEIRNDAGLVIGNNKLQLLVSGTNGVITTNDASFGLAIGTTGNVGQITLRNNGNITLGLTGAIVEVAQDPSTSRGIATKGYVDGLIAGTQAGQVALLKRDGSVTLTGALRPDTNAGTDLGTSSLRFNNVYANTFTGTSSRALYADLAERFEADSSYQPGTVVELGGTAEITKVGQELSESVFGVISTRAAYLMNAGAGEDATHPPVAISGRVPVRVIGKVRKGDRLVSAGNGLARSASRDEMTPWNVIGRALQNKETTGEGTVEAIVKLNS